MKVLIVDDEPLIRRSLEKIFQRQGHETCLAVDGDSGLESWKTFKPDVVVIDILMPGKTGPEVIAAAQSFPKCGVILISAYSGDYNLESARQLGADLFFAKPFDDIRDLVQAAENLFQEYQK